jgi:hypothetical protein
MTNVVGFTYADRDAKQRWANAAAGGWNLGMGNIGMSISSDTILVLRVVTGGQLLAGAVKSQVGKMFGSS